MAHVELSSSKDLIRHRRARSNSSSDISEASDRSFELEMDAVPSRPHSSMGIQQSRGPPFVLESDAGVEEALSQETPRGQKPWLLSEREFHRSESPALRLVSGTPRYTTLPAVFDDVDTDQSPFRGNTPTPESPSAWTTVSPTSTSGASQEEVQNGPRNEETSESWPSLESNHFTVSPSSSTFHRFSSPFPAFRYVHMPPHSTSNVYSPGLFPTGPLNTFPPSSVPPTPVLIQVFHHPFNPLAYQPFPNWIYPGSASLVGNSIERPPEPTPQSPPFHAYSDPNAGFHVVSHFSFAPTIHNEATNFGLNSINEHYNGAVRPSGRGEIARQGRPPSGDVLGALNGTAPQPRGRTQSPANLKKETKSTGAQSRSSSILDRFIATSTTERDQWPLETVRGSLFEFATDRRGSLWLQNKLAVECDRQGKGARAFETTHRWVFNELRGAIVRLSLDVFGNFIAQPFYALCSEVQRKIFLAELQPWVPILCKDRYGCRVVQAMLVYGGLDAHATVSSALQCDILDISNSEHGNHVVQAALSQLRTDRQACEKAFIANISPIAMGKYGCKAVKHAYSALPRAQANQIVDAIVSNSWEIVNDPHANYVWQYIVRNGSPDHRWRLISNISSRFGELAQRPFASWCCQIALECGEEAQRVLLLNELFELKPSVFGELATQKNSAHVFLTTIKILQELRWNPNTIRPLIAQLKQVQHLRLSTEIRLLLAQVIDRLRNAAEFQRPPNLHLVEHKHRSS